MIDLKEKNFNTLVRDMRSIWMSPSFTRLGTFSAIITLNKLSCPFSLFSFWDFHNAYNGPC